jgi:hypothetical protein
MVARIYRPAQNQMQSGTARTRQWVLDFEPASPRRVEPLMGWTSTTDMSQELRLTFDTKEEAIAYAQREGIPFRVFEAKGRTPKRIAYSDNFKWSRPEPWTH